MSEVTPDAVFKALPDEVQERITASGSKGVDPVNILVIGPTGSGKSSLVNTLFGSVVAEEGRGACSVTTEMKMYKGKFMGVNIHVYDTVGFSDTEGRSDEDTMREIARMNEFALILICVRMDSRVDRNIQKMFTTLSDNMHPDAWKRAIVLLKFSDVYIKQDNIRPDEKEETMRKGIEDYKEAISKAVNNPAFKNVPFCPSEKVNETSLPGSDANWLARFWRICLKSLENRVLAVFEAYTIYLATKFLMMLGPMDPKVIAIIGGGIGGGIGAVIGAVVGAFFGSAIPGAGTARGALQGGAMGGYAGATGCYKIILRAADAMARGDLKAIKQDKCKEL